MPSPRDLTIRPLAIGEVIDRAVALTIRHFKVLFLAMLVVQLPALAFYRTYAASLQQAFGEALARPPAAFAGLAGASASFAALLAFLQLAATAAAAVVVAPSLLGRPPEASLAALGRSLLARAWPIASSAALQMLLLVAAPAVGAVPGLLLAWRAGTAATRLVGLGAALLGAVVLLLGVLLRLVLAPAAAGVEGLPGFRALARSARLMAPGRGLSLEERPGLRASILLLATFLIALAANGLAGLPRAVAVIATGRSTLGTALPLAVDVGLAVFEALANAAVQPFSLVALAVFYFDRRARREGLDLELWADGLAGPWGGGR
jgi:hypothetical protein